MPAPRTEQPQPMANRIPMVKQNRIAQPRLTAISPQLEDVARTLDQWLSDTDPHLKPILDDYHQGHGKMLRPALLLLSGKATGTLNDQHIKIAAAIQMLHNATLLHDDVIDNGHMRRGAATINARWSNATAVLLGDFLLAKVFNVCSDVPQRLTQPLAQVTSRICRGELVQSLRKDQPRIDRELYFEIIQNKTASLLQCSCELGARLSEAPQQQVDALSQFGLNCGLAFQIVDDLLDVLAGTTHTGKTTNRDAAASTFTLPAIHLLENTPANRRLPVKEIFADGDKQKIKQTLIESGSIAYALDQANGFIEKARQHLLDLPANQAQKQLNDLARFIVNQITPLV